VALQINCQRGNYQAETSTTEGGFTGREPKVIGMHGLGTDFAKNRKQQQAWEQICRGGNPRVRSNSA
jgi:hypothetical protein